MGPHRPVLFTAGAMSTERGGELRIGVSRDNYRSQGRDVKTGPADAEALDAASAPSTDEPAMRCCYMLQGWV